MNERKRGERRGSRAGPGRFAALSRKLARRAARLGGGEDEGAPVVRNATAEELRAAGLLPPESEES